MLTLMRPFKIAHISDLHINICNPELFSYPEDKDISCNSIKSIERRLKEFIDKIKDRNVDFIAVTGDLVDAVADSQDFADVTRDYIMKKRSWYKRIKEYYLRVKNILKDSGIPYVALPGNHDFAPVLLETFTMDYLNIDGIYIKRFLDYENAVHVPVRSDRFMWESLLSDSSRPVQVHLQHFLIYPDINEEYPYTYINGNMMKELMAWKINNNRLLLSLSGHYHPGTEFYQFNNCYFSTASAFYKPLSSFRIYSIFNKHIESEEITSG